MTQEYKDGSKAKIIESLGSKPSISEERGLSLIDTDDLVVFSPGISTAGFAEIRMARANPQRKVIATTIDEKGLGFAQEVINEVGLQNHIDTKLEDLRDGGNYPNDYFDFVYARLVLHYLSSQDLDKVLADFHRTLKPEGKLFVVVRSIKNIPLREDVTFDQSTQMTSIPHYNEKVEVSYMETRYFHTPESIRKHLEKANFAIKETQEYQEQLYKDFMRKEIAPIVDHVIEVQAVKV
jgi:ubiquinone/menaquinone biosynthesis C-methylase UbiE